MSLSRRQFLHASAAAATAGPIAAFSQDSGKKMLGVTVLPEYIQSEGIDGVLENLIHKVGATAVTTSPYVMAEADKETGNREPPADAGAGSVRLLDRPLFGKREVWVTTAPSFEPKKELYDGLRYRPAPPTDLTRREGGIVAEFVEAAKKAGLKVYFQIQAAIPPGYRVQFGGPVEDDQPRLPDGSVPPRRLAKNGTLCSPEIVGYEHALIRDLLAQYPNIDGIRFDWPEFPPYFLDSCFVDFGPHAKAAAARLGFDFDLMQREVGAFYQKLLGGLTNRDLGSWLTRDFANFGMARGLSNHPGIGEFLRFKATVVEETVAGFRRVMDEAGGADKAMMPNAFPPPFTLATGLDFGRVGRHSTAISSKLYSMHWMMILRFYGDAILEKNPGLDSKLLTRALVKTLGIADGAGLENLEDYRYPGPEEPHAYGPKAMARKIRQAQAEAGKCPVYTLGHGYGPVDDYRERMRIGWEASRAGMWVNRYAYLTDEKLKILGEVTK
ncbi:MAG: twin-arginine translocation signal domain-containing protein [Verrucomicrobiae bacterium]|nr:twin-arginine translocation signal domain-containing protein [Verrucomicrobiae bacterium]MCP5540430.1 twin-arginine translocation signal domain-containing protein [Akkermansiaceae bacterium]